jgi:O-methyltransferase
LRELETILPDIVAQVRPSTMLSDDALTFTWRAGVELLEAGLPGAFVECGTWLGGCSFGLALVQKRIFGRVMRPVLMLDSFEGLPPATDRDGPAANEYQRRTSDPGYFDNCSASIDQVRRIRDSLGLREEDCPLLQGWFDATVPPLARQLQERRIALLRVDCDWYDPVALVLECLEPLVSEEGIVILDDYFAWDGAARAVHDYLSHHDLPYRLRQIGAEPVPSGAWFRKRAARQFQGPV